MIKNPRSRLIDFIPKQFKVWWKANIPIIGGNRLYHTIIPATSNHHRFILGAQPRISDLLQISNQGLCKIHIISMLSKSESIINDANSYSFLCFHYKPWLDHGIINLDVQLDELLRNETVESIREFQEGCNNKSGLYQEFFISRNIFKNVNNCIFYCHCMAGKSRSFLEVLAFLYLYPEKEKLFDFENWPEKYTKKISVIGLNEYLRDNPSISEIAKFVNFQRPQTRTIMNMDGDQSGLLGLLTLDKWAHDLEFNSNIIKNRDIKRRLIDMQNIGLMLKAPLDQGFRAPSDRERQEKNLMLVYQAYKNEKINLLMAMIISLNEQITLDNYEKEFEINFRKLSANEQARFAILLSKLEDNPSLDLKPLHNAEYYAKIAVEKSKKLTAGDQIELLSTFKNIPGISYNDVINKLRYGSKIDRYNAEIQLTRLQNIFC